MRRKFQIVGAIEGDTKVFGTTHAQFSKLVDKEFGAQFAAIKQAMSPRPAEPPFEFASANDILSNMLDHRSLPSSIEGTIVKKVGRKSGIADAMEMIRKQLESTNSTSDGVANVIMRGTKIAGIVDSGVNVIGRGYETPVSAAVVKSAESMYAEKTVPQVAVKTSRRANQKDGPR